ncbi:MAG: hypothetical protein U0694_21840 [Anaerolineae bacterium]
MSTNFRFMVLLTVLLLSVSHVYAQEATPEAPAPRRLLFVSERDGNREIYVVNDDGTDLQNLTNNPAEDAYPAWSPDGSRIAFQSDRDGNWDIYVMDANGGNLQNRTNTPTDEQRPVWDPFADILDYQTSGFAARNPTPSPNGFWRSQRELIDDSWQLTGFLEVGATIAEGDSMYRIFTPSGTDVGAFVWSPNSDQIAFERNGEIYAIEVGDDVRPSLLPRNLTLSEAYDSSPAWSPVGNQIAYVSNWEIFVMDSWDGRSAYNLSQNPAYDISPAWSPDAQQVAFASFRDDNWEVYAMNSDGCNVRRLTNDNGWDGLPQWQPDRERSTAVDPSSRVAATERPPTAVVTTPNANLRDGPGENFNVIATASQRECLSVVGRNADGSWLQIQHGDTMLWVSASIVDIVGDVTDIQVIEP